MESKENRSLLDKGVIYIIKTYVQDGRSIDECKAVDKPDTKFIARMRFALDPRVPPINLDVVIGVDSIQKAFAIYDTIYEKTREEFLKHMRSQIVVPGSERKQ